MTDDPTRRGFLGTAALTALAGCSSQTMPNEDDTEGLEGQYSFPPESYRPADMPESMLKRNEIHNWVASAHLEVQTSLLQQQNQLLKEIRDELKEGSSDE